MNSSRTLWLREIFAQESPARRFGVRNCLFKKIGWRRCCISLRRSQLTVSTATVVWNAYLSWLSRSWAINGFPRYSAEFKTISTIADAAEASTRIFCGHSVTASQVPDAKSLRLTQTRANQTRVEAAIHPVWSAPRPRVFTQRGQHTVGNAFNFLARPAAQSRQETPEVISVTARDNAADGKTIGSIWDSRLDFHRAAAAVWHCSG